MISIPKAHSIQLRKRGAEISPPHLGNIILGFPFINMHKNTENRMSYHEGKILPIYSVVATLGGFLSKTHSEFTFWIKS